MGIKKQLTDAALLGFGAAAGRAAFERAKRELFGDEDVEEKPVDPVAEAKRVKAAAKEAERVAKEEAKQRAKEAEERKKARAKLEHEVDADLASLKKKLRK